MFEKKNRNPIAVAVVMTTTLRLGALPRQPLPVEPLRQRLQQLLHPWGQEHL